MSASRIAIVAAGLILLPLPARAQPSTRLPTFGIVSPGNQHTCALLAGAAPGAGVGVDCWGRNQQGQLGDFTSTDRPRPVPVMNLTDAVRLSTNFQHTCVVTDIGTAKCWGDNTYGQVGNGTSGNAWLGAVEVCASGMGFDCIGGIQLSGVVQVATGGSHSCALLNGGHIRCWGDGFNGQLGNGQSGDGAGALEPVEVPGLTNMAGVWAGGDNTCAITNPTGPQSTNDLYCWGNNFSGQLGLGSAPATPLQSGETCPTTAEPNAKCVSLPVAVPGVGSIPQVDPGQTTCAVTSTGGAKCWGFNAHGEVGNGTVVTNPNPFNPVFGYAQPTPVDVLAAPGGLPLAGVAAIAGQCALILGGAVNCWGDNLFGALGDGTTTDRTTPVTVQFDGEATAIGAGSAHNCAVMSTGGLKCWGLNSFGQLGTGTPGVCSFGLPCSPVPVDVCLSGDFELVGLEVNQAVQSWQNSVPLITGKSTMVRAHVQPQGPDPIRVVAKLRAFRNGTELPGSPLASYNPGSSVVAMATAVSRRGVFKDSLDWRVPDDWTSGTVDFQVDSCANIKCSEPAEAGGTAGDCKVHVTFQDGPRTNLMLVGLKFKDAAGTTHTTSQASLDETADRLLAMFPVSKITYTTAQLRLPAATQMAAHARPFTDQALAALNGFRTGGLCNDPCDQLFAGIYTSPNPNDVVAGIAYFVLGKSANGSISSLSPLGARGGYNFGQEIAHNLGLGHALHMKYGPAANGLKQGPCGEGAVYAGEPDWPYIYTDAAMVDHAAIGPFNMGEAGKMFGYDSQNARVADPTMNFDVMSYCGPSWEWISDYTYRNLISAMTNRWPPLPAPAVVPRVATAPYAIVRGLIHPVENTVELMPFGRADLAAAPTPPEAGPYTLEARDGAGTLLTSIPFGPLPAYVGTGHDDAPGYNFAIEVPAPPELNEVRIVQGAVVLASRMASPHAPTVQVGFPNGGENLTAPTVTFSWSAADVDGDPLTYTVEYSADGGATWVPLTVDWTDTTLDVDLEWLAGTANGLVRVSASDGFNVTSDVSNAVFSVPNHPPVVRILPPTGTTPIVGEQTVVLRGTARDREDGPLAAAALRWTSDLSGDLGTGETLLVSSLHLAEGTHTITLTATDSTGLSASASIQLHVYRHGPVCGDGILDPGEQCDDATANGTGDCCSSTCQFEPLGASCAGGTCNGAGVCVPTPTTTSTTTTTVTSTLITVTSSSTSTTTSTSTSLSSSTSTSTTGPSTTTTSTSSTSSSTSTRGTSSTTSTSSSTLTTTTTVAVSTTSTTLGCSADRLTCICRAGLTVAACAGQPVPVGIGKKYAQACHAAAQLATSPAKRLKKLHKTAESNLKQARVLATKAGKRKISGDCARAIVARLS